MLIKKAKIYYGSCQIGNLHKRGYHKKHYLIAVFFYLEKANETTWKFGIVKDVHSLGL